MLKELNNPQGLPFAEFTALIEAFGFSFQRQRGSHRIFAREDVLEIVDGQPTQDHKAKDVQVQDFLKLVAKYQLSLEDRDA